MWTTVGLLIVVGCWGVGGYHSDVIMGAIASQITSLAVVYWTVYPGADQRKHQNSTSLAFVRGIHRWPVNYPHKGSVTWKMFPFDDDIMIDRDMTALLWMVTLHFVAFGYSIHPHISYEVCVCSLANWTSVGPPCTSSVLRNYILCTKINVSINHSIHWAIKVWSFTVNPRSF